MKSAPAERCSQQHCPQKARGHDYPFTTEVVTFKHPFRIRGVDRLLPAGPYEIVTDEEMIEGLSFAAFRRVATMIKVPAEASRVRSSDLDRLGRSGGRATHRREHTDG